MTDEWSFAIPARFKSSPAHMVSEVGPASTNGLLTMVSVKKSDKVFEQPALPVAVNVNVVPPLIMSLVPGA